MVPGGVSQPLWGIWRPPDGVHAFKSGRRPSMAYSPYPPRRLSPAPGFNRFGNRITGSHPPSTVLPTHGDPWGERWIRSARIRSLRQPSWETERGGVAESGPGMAHVAPERQGRRQERGATPPRSGAHPARGVCSLLATRPYITPFATPPPRTNTPTLRLPPRAVPEGARADSGEESPWIPACAGMTFCACAGRTASLKRRMRARCGRRAARANLRPTPPAPN